MGENPEDLSPAAPEPTRGPAHESPHEAALRANPQPALEPTGETSHESALQANPNPAPEPTVETSHESASQASPYSALEPTAEASHETALQASPYSTLEPTAETYHETALQPYSSPAPEGSWKHPPESDPEPITDEGGGPVKTFIEHLEDLRWTLIKCAVTYAVSFILCLSGANYITKLLKWPLDQAMTKRTTSNHTVTFLVGTNVIGREPALDSSLPGVPTNANSVYRLTPVQIGTNWVAAFQLETNPPLAAMRQASVELKNFGPISAFNIVMQIALYGGLTLAAPLMLFFIGQFVLPALHVPEKKFLYKVAGWASFLFLLGVTLCYLIFLVICLSTTVSFSNWLGFGSDQWQAEQYISFVLWFMVGMGIAFQLPLVLLTLVKIGLLDAAKLSSFRMYWVVVGLVIAAFITPDGNPINMVILFLPLEILYEMTVIIAWYWERKEKRMAAAADSGTSA